MLVDADGAIVVVNREFERMFGYPRSELIGASIDALVPELRNVIERAVILAEGRQLRVLLPAEPSRTGERLDTLADVERRHIAAVLADCGGRLGGDDGAAARLGLTIPALRGRLMKLRLRRPRR